MPAVTICILNWNGAETIEQCLNSIFDITEYNSFSVIVVDNGSSDGSVDLIRDQFPAVTLIENERNRGFPKGVNQALDVALNEDTDYAVLLNNDTRIVDPNWLLKIIHTAETDESIGILGCKNVHPDGSIDHDGAFLPLHIHSPPDLAERYAYTRDEGRNSARGYKYVDLVQGSAFVIKSEVIKEIGKLDEAYSPLYYEEYDYCLRAWDAGFRVAYVPDVEIVHEGQQSGFSNIERAYYLKRNEMRFMLINYPPSWLAVTLPIALFKLYDLFIWCEDGEAMVRWEFRQHPHRPVVYFLKFWYVLGISLPSIVSKCQDRHNAKQLLK